MLRGLIVQFPEQYADMALLLDKDPELDFFNNVAHLQLHRRQRALQRLTRVSPLACVLNFDVLFDTLGLASLLLLSTLVLARYDLLTIKAFMHGQAKICGAL